MEVSVALYDKVLSERNEYRDAYADLLEVASFAAGIYCKSEYAGLSWGHDAGRVMAALRDAVEEALPEEVAKHKTRVAWRG
jgi:hypothetical protein